MLIDSNPVFRGACRALLMTEGVDVVATCAPEHGAINVVRRLRPQVVLAEVGDGVLGEQIASLICSLPDPPVVLLISTHDHPDLAAAVHAHGHLAKADICAEAIAHALH
jgi:DNA-binding NarL/FixJ family response regulator